MTDGGRQIPVCALTLTVVVFPGQRSLVAVTISVMDSVGEEERERSRAAFETVLPFIAGPGRLNSVVTGLEWDLDKSSGEEAAEKVAARGIDETTLAAALRVRRDVGRINDLIHALVVSAALPLILDPGERIVNRPSLAAGNDPGRKWDLETDRRIIEFKAAGWATTGNAARQRSTVQDLVGLAGDDSGREAELWVLGKRPVHYVNTSTASLRWALEKSSEKIRTNAEQFGSMTVAEFRHGPAGKVRVEDVSELLPALKVD